MMNNKTFIIAEAGVNHNGNLEMAIEMVKQAVDAGADAIKFQMAVPELVATKFAEKADYQKATTGFEESQLEMIKKLHFPLEQYIAIKEHCEKNKILFLASAFDMVSLDFLNGLGVCLHKIPSGEITNYLYIKKIAECGLPVLISTGMAKLGEIEEAITVCENEGLPRNKIKLLHCTTSYPTSMDNVNLLALNTLRSAFGVVVGYSDHTLGIEVALAAVAMGAKVIEKHFTLDRNLPGPDQKASLEPVQFREMVSSIRNIERAFGDGFKCPQESETANISVVRRSLVASCDISIGDRFSEQNVTAKRPGTGISPMRWNAIVGRIAMRNYAQDDLIDL